MSKKLEETEKMVEELHKQVYGDPETQADDGLETMDVVDGDLEGQVVPEPQPGEQQQPVSDDYKQKYETLQGMYNADIPKLQQQVAFLQGMLADQSPTASNKQTQQQSAPEQTNEDLDFVQKEYPYMVTAINAIVDQKLAYMQQTILREVSQAMQGLAGQVNNLGVESGQTRDSLFWSRLSDLVPDWESLNTNKGFLEWLDEKLPFSNVSKFDLLKQARAEFNANKAAEFFTSYKEEKGIVTTPNKQQGRRIVAPGRSAGSVGQNQTIQAGDKPLTREEIAAFYDRVRRGYYVGKEKEESAMRDRIAQMAASFSSKNR